MYFNYYSNNEFLTDLIELSFTTNLHLCFTYLIDVDIYLKFGIGVYY